jgi:hypothetical protein
MLNLSIKSEDIGYLRLLLDLANIDNKENKVEKKYKLGLTK